MGGILRTSAQLVGGPSGTGDIIVKPPWAGRCEAILEYITALGNTAANIISVAADSPTQLMGGGTTALASPTDGGLWVINGPGSLGLSHLPIGLSSFLRISPLAAANGSIYLSFYWQKVADFAPPVLMTPPEPTEAEEMSEENETWRKLRQLPPREFLNQNPGKLTPEQEKNLKELEKLTNMRNHPARPIR